jgi:proline dehydrogenase
MRRGAPRPERQGPANEYDPARRRCRLACAGEAVVVEYERILARLSAEGLGTNVALKLTHLGLTIDQGLARENLERIVATAARLGSFIRIDMEESRHVDSTLAIYRDLREKGLANVGAALQACLRRSESDVRELLPLRPNLRLVKGAYLESPRVAFPAKRDVDVNFLRLIEAALDGEGFTAIATHDERAIEHAIAHAGRRGLEPAGRFEFQMLYGVRPGLQLDLVRRGYPVLIATPFGADWYPYLMRRLAERPANTLFLLRNLARR